jgi:adenosylcobinamide kinase/adenosylcobinamide-phosphate guanylyltransferase
MKALFIGGVKSGKSLNAEKYTLSLSKKKPIYLATTEFIDSGMQARIEAHKEQRKDNFLTLEESLSLYDVLKERSEPILVECLSMWINNMMYHKQSFEAMQNELTKLLTLQNSIVFVLNDVGTGVVPENKLAREFIDISGKLSQLVASGCDEVYQTIAGISTRIK